jgi:hypothetical protein
MLVPVLSGIEGSGVPREGLRSVSLHEDVLDQVRDALESGKVRVPLHVRTVPQFLEYAAGQVLTDEASA